MRVLVIGGTRYMGRVVVRRCLARGDEVVLYTRGNTRPDYWDDVGHILGDRTDRDSFKRNLAGERFDAVIDMQAYRREDIDSVLEALAGRVGRYVMTSTGSVYADGYVEFANTCPFPESALDHSRVTWDYPPGEHEYGVGKRHCEKRLLEQDALPWTVVRVPAVMGWDDPTHRMWFFAQRALDGGPLLWPAEERAPWRTLYVEDAAGALLGVLETEQTRNQIYHVSMHEVLTPERWADRVWLAAGADADLVYVPRAVIERELDDSVPYFPRSTPYLQDLGKSETDFGFTTTPLDDWLATTIAWYRDEYAGPASRGYARRTDELRLAQHWRAASERLAASFALG